MPPLFALVALAGSLAAQPSLVRIVAIADASTTADLPAANFGTALIVTCGKDFANMPFRVWMTRGHFQFDVSTLVGRPLPTRVLLRLWQDLASAAGCLDVTAHRVTQAWSESTVTWQNQPSHDPTVLASACVGDANSGGWKVFDVTQAVHGWLNNTYPNHGLVIRDPSEQTPGAARPLYAASREWPTANVHPHLEVAYDTLPFGTGCGTAVYIPTLDIYDGTPALGGTYTLRALGIGANANVVHLLGLSNTTWNGLPLPFSLAFLGYPTCNVLAAGDLMVPGTADWRGIASISVPVPNQPRLVGLRLFHQAVGGDQNLMLALTNGFVARVF